MKKSANDVLLNMSGKIGPSIPLARWEKFLNYIIARKGFGLNDVRGKETANDALKCIHEGVLDKMNDKDPEGRTQWFIEFQQRSNVIKAAERFVEWVEQGSP